MLSSGQSQTDTQDVRCASTGKSVVLPFPIPTYHTEGIAIFYHRRDYLSCEPVAFSGWINECPRHHLGASVFHQMQRHRTCYCTFRDNICPLLRQLDRNVKREKRSKQAWKYLQPRHMLSVCLHSIGRRYIPCRVPVSVVIGLSFSPWTDSLESRMLQF